MPVAHSNNISTAKAVFVLSCLDLIYGHAMHILQSPQTFHLNCLSCPSAMFTETCHTQREPSVLQQIVLVPCSKRTSHCYTHTLARARVCEIGRAHV